MRKKMLSLALALVICLPLMPSAFATTFSHDKTADELTREELLECCTTWVWWNSRSTVAQDLTTEELRQVYQNYLDDFNRYLAKTENWQAVLASSVETVAVGPASKFTDVPTDAQYLNELHYAVGNGYISGTSATTFSPNGNITRGQFVTILGKMLSVDADNGTTLFTDVPETAFYAPYVEWAASNGYVNGTSSTTFSPDSNITFEQMATILTNYITKSGVVIDEVSPAIVYKDAASVSTWAVNSVEAARKYGLIKPDAYNNLNPQKSVSRADGAVSLVTLARATGLGVEPVIEQKPVTQVSTETPVEKTPEIIVSIAHDELWASGAITSSMTEKEKAIVYFKWLCLNSCYHDSALYPRRHSVYGSLVDGVGVCDGLSYGYKKLLDTEGIKSICVPLWEKNHMYVEALLDGEWYHINPADVNWTHDPDSSFSEFGFEIYRAKFFDNPIDGPSLSVD